MEQKHCFLAFSELGSLPERNGDKLVQADLLPSIGFMYRADDFSFQISLPDDPRFWWRTEFSNDPEVIVITDFSSGEQTDSVMGLALTTILRKRCPAVKSTLVTFQDLHPQSSYSTLSKIQTRKKVAQIIHWLRFAATALELNFFDGNVASRRGKLDLFFSMIDGS